MRKIITLAIFCFSFIQNHAQSITAAEYFIDTDPGCGNGTPLSVSPTGTTVNFTASISTTLLSTGMHYLCIRTLDATGIWGLFESRLIYVSNTTGNTSDIVSAEYFIDTDPGAGIGMPLSVGTTGPIVNFTAVIPVSLPLGFHYLAIRVKNADGNWGLFETRLFYSSGATTDMVNIVDAEYFFDTDPGIGNGIPFSFTTPGNTINETISTPIPILPNGTHYLVMRVRDANNYWSLFDTLTLTTINTLPLHLLRFSGKKINDETLLEWLTENEENTSHFEIERSRNGMDFVRIGLMVSVNTPGTNDYSFVDSQPLKGLNYYRLKQMDRDGRFEYSVILKILFDRYGKPMILYPNPASDYVQFMGFAGKQKTVYITIYDTQGREVMNTAIANQEAMKINIINLPYGEYFVQLSDGEAVASGKFIKK